MLYLVYLIISLAMPTHPQAAFLKEFEVAIDHLVPTVPADLKKEAQALLTDLKANPKATEDEIRAAVVRIGRAEYPHRHAWAELTTPTKEAKLQEIVFDHIDASVRKKIESCLASGVNLDQFVRSPLFEESLTPEERYQVEDAILDAPHHIDELLEKTITADSPTYKKAYDRWLNEEEKILAAIDKLEAMQHKDPKWKDEIVHKVARFREGFSVTETDPTLEEVEREIEYWEGVLVEE